MKIDGKEVSIEDIRLDQFIEHEHFDRLSQLQQLARDRLVDSHNVNYENSDQRAYFRSLENYISCLNAQANALVPDGIPSIPKLSNAELNAALDGLAGCKTHE